MMSSRALWFIFLFFSISTDVGLVATARNDQHEPSEGPHDVDTAEDQLVFPHGELEGIWRNGDKVEMLGNLFIEALADSDSYLTLVAWQRILNHDGSLQEIRAIELAIPPKLGPGGAEAHGDDDEDIQFGDRSIPLESIVKIKQDFQVLGTIDLPTSITFELFQRSGESSGLFYLDTNQLIIKGTDFSIYNKTIVTTQSEVDTFIGALKQSAKNPLNTPTVLKYSSSGKLLDNSEINPAFLGLVVDYDDIPDDILLESPKIIAEVALKFDKEQVPQELSKVYKTKWPEYDWRVLVNQESVYLSKNVAITLNWDAINFFDDSDVEYYVYGWKNE